jgi:GntR family transcriptional regulator
MPIVFSLNPSDGLPLYIQLINVIKTAIAENYNRVMAYLRNVSSGNAGDSTGYGTKAFQQLFDEGSLFASKVQALLSPHLRQSLPLLESFSEMVDASGGQAQSELVGYQRRVASSLERQILQVSQGRTRWLS